MPMPMPLPPPPIRKICVFASTLSGHSPAHVASALSLAAVLHAHNIHLVYGGGTTGLMGALAKERVRLGGKESVMGVIPNALVEVEREGTVGCTGSKSGVSLSQAEAEAPGWRERGKGLLLRMMGRKGEGIVQEGKSQDSTTTTPPLDSHSPTKTQKASLLKEEIYGLTTTTSSLAARKTLMISLIAAAGPGSGFVALSGGFGTLDEVMEVVTARQMGIHHRQMVLYNVEGFWDGLVGWVEGAIGKGFLREGAKEALRVGGSAEECVRFLLLGEIEEGGVTGGN